MNNEVKKFIENKGWEFKEVINNQLNVKICPMCEDGRWKFYINSENGCWDCKLCGGSGNFYQLKARLGDLTEITSTSNIFENKQEILLEVLSEYQKNLNNSPEALKYLTETRGFTLENIEKFKLGLEGDFIVIPHIQDGKFWNAKFRNYKQKGFKRIAGQPSILFNLDNINYNKPGLVIVESETDCISATQLGVRNVISITTGAQAFPPEWLPYIKQFKEIYICLNSDRPGQIGARKLAEKIGINRCKNVILPVKDVNEYLLTVHDDDEKDDFIKLLKKATKIELDNISSISDYVNDLDAWFEGEGTLCGHPIPFTRLNSYLNGFKEEDLIVLTGVSGCGKTTWSLNVLNDFLKSGKKCFCFFLEGKLMFYILRMMSIEFGIDINKLREDKQKWEEIKKIFSSYPLYFYSGPQSDIDTKKIVELTKATVDTYDIDFIAIDNLQEFVADNQYTTQNTATAVTAIKKLAVDTKKPILLIAHVKNPTTQRKRVTKFDLKNGSATHQKADIILALWNNKKDNSCEDNFYLSIEKNRMGVGNVDIKMVFQPEYGIFSERVDSEEIIKEEVTKFKNIKSKDDNFKSLGKKYTENDTI